jgi:hypothetical protein
MHLSFKAGWADGYVGIEIDSDDVSVEGFVFNGNDQAIKICGVNHVNISQILSQTTTGVCM